MLDCGGRDDEIPEQLLESLKFISPNESELARLLNIDIKENIDINIIREKLLKKYQNLIVVLKLGSKGSAILTSSDYYECKSVTL